MLCTGDPVDLVAEADGDYSFTWTNIDTRQIISRTNTVTVTPVRTGAYFVQVDLGSCNSAIPFSSERWTRQPPSPV